MIRRILSISLFVVISVQFVYGLPNSLQLEKTKKGITSYVLLDEIDEIIPNSVRIQKPTSSVNFNYKLVNDDEFCQSTKTSSVFYIHNQLLPKTLFLRKIQSSFFTFYFSTAV